MTRRLHLLAWLLAGPAVAAAAGVIALEVWRARAPDAPLFSTPFAYSLADAIQRDDVQRAHAFIRAGQDPNAPIPVRHPTLTGDRQLLIAPLLWAVAVDGRQSVRMLIGYGARFDPPTRRAAMCIVTTFVHGDMMSLLRRFGADDPAPPCPGADEPSDMLAAFAAGG